MVNDLMYKTYTATYLKRYQAVIKSYEHKFNRRQFFYLKNEDCVRPLLPEGWTELKDLWQLY